MSQSILDLVQVNAGGLYLELFGKYWEIEGSAEGQVFAPNPQITTVVALPRNALGPTLGSDSFIFGASTGTWYLMCDGNHTAYPISGAGTPGYYQFNPNPFFVSALVSEWILAVTKVSQQIITAPPQ